jgi:hypothetical protein
MTTKEIPPHATIRFMRVRCGNPDCRCAAGGDDRHGPYYYAQWRERGTTRRHTVYIGKTLERIE